MSPVAVVDGAVVLDGDGRVSLKGGIAAEGFEAIHVFRDGWLWAGYLRDATGVWWFHGRTAKAVFVTDSEVFRVLDDDYGLGAAGVYLEDRLIPGADPDSFELLDNTPYFAKDRHRVYVKGGKQFFHFDRMDVASAVANGPYLADRDHLFHHYSGLSEADDQKDSAEVQQGAPDEHGILLKDWLARHYSHIVGWWHPGYVAPPQDSEIELFGRDAQHVYYNGYVVEGADPASFILISERFGKDKRHVFQKDFARTSWPFGHPDTVMVAVKNSDPDSFAVFGERGAWACDANQVYLWGEPKKKLDPVTFEFLGETPTNSWARDAAGLYRSNGSLKVAGIDGSTFVALDETWGTDGSSVFCFATGAVARAADAATFRVTGDGAEDDAAQYRLVNGSVRRIKK
jgi:DKNYY family